MTELSRVTKILFKTGFTTQLPQVAEDNPIYGGKKILISLISTNVVEKIDGCLMEMV